MLSFDEYGFNDSILKSLEELSFKVPTDIQRRVIPEILSDNNNIIATAQTGTGKTAAFGLPIITLTDNRDKNIECVILCPTRELCLQITNDLNTYSKYMKYYRIVSIYGGAKTQVQIKNLKQNPKIIVCTPGRLNDLINRKKVDLSFVKYFVLDEADEMLSMGFKSEIDKVLSFTPHDRKIYLFSATLSQRVKKITKTYMENSLMISASPVNKGADNVSHEYFICNKNKRYDLIKNIIDINKDIYTIIFCRTRRETKDISKRLISDSYNAKVLNGDLSQTERDHVMYKFRNKKINILVATDVASRGIDVDNLSHIINYNLPDDPEVYVHRSGRTGRAGKSGLSLVFVTKKELQRLNEIKKLSKISFKEAKVPTDDDIFKSRITTLVDNVINAPTSSTLDTEILKHLYMRFNKFTKDELIGKIISLNIGQGTKPKPSKNTKEDSKRAQTTNDNKKFVKLSINIGRANSVGPEVLIRLINKTIRSRDTEIGKIDIKKHHSTFEVESKIKDAVISKMKLIRHNRKNILVSDYNKDTTNTSINRKNKSRNKKKKYF